MDMLSDSVNSSLFNPFPSTPPPSVDTSLPPDIEALRRLSLNLSSLFLSQNPNFSDFELCLSPSQSISLHKCILSSRSPYFHNLFATAEDGSISKFELGTIFGEFEVGYEALVYVVGYLYSGTVGLLPRGICECADAECGHMACWPVVDFMLQVLFASFRFEISELVNMFQIEFDAEHHEVTTITCFNSFTKNSLTRPPSIPNPQPCQSPNSSAPCPKSSASINNSSSKLTTSPKSPTPPNSSAIQALTRKSTPKSFDSAPSLTRNLNSKPLNR